MLYHIYMYNHLKLKVAICTMYSVQFGKPRRLPAVSMYKKEFCVAGFGTLDAQDLHLFIESNGHPIRL